MARADLSELAVCVVPACRCGVPVSHDPLSFCGAIATWMRALNAGVDPVFTCDDHRLEGDQPIPADRVFRRVRVTAEIFLCGVSSDSTIAQSEAVAALEAAVARLGGHLDLQRVWSSRVRAGLPAGAGQGKAAGGDIW